MKCIEEEKLSGVFYSFLAGSASVEVGELTAEQATCLRELVDGSDILLIAGTYAEPSPEAERMLMVVAFGVLDCIPELAGSAPGPSPEAPDDSLIWSYPVGGPVVTGPVLAEGVVYAGSDDGTLYALYAESGELLWSFATGGPIRSISGEVEGTVYVGSNDHHLYALDAYTGEELWRYDTGDPGTERSGGGRTARCTSQPWESMTG